MTAHRHADSALFLKALWMDVDVKPSQPNKAYTTLDEAMDAIKKFVDEAGLPAPSAFVTSGGGVHVYWFSKSKLTLAEWKPYAEGLKAEALRLGLKCDAAVTADAARVLRVPGTFNNKVKGMPPPGPAAASGRELRLRRRARHRRAARQGAGSRCYRDGNKGAGGRVRPAPRVHQERHASQTRGYARSRE